MLLTPPLTFACGRFSLIHFVAFDEIDGVVVVLLHAGRDGEDVRIENDVLRRKADLVA